MAWRIDEYVIRGEIDNRVRGRVTGRLWLVGRRGPVELDLEGNAWRDLAGRRLEFINPAPKPGKVASLAALQVGAVGDCTASRRVKVPDVSEAELEHRLREGGTFPWHWSNCLYLEWFSGINGRVVIESVAFELRITGDAAWDMTGEEEERQRRANAEVLRGFLDRLVTAAEPPISDDAAGREQVCHSQPPRHPEAPLTEEEAEALQAESDRLADRIEARIAREGPDADIARIITEELERRQRERGEAPLTPEEEAEREAWIDEMNRAAEQAPGPDAETDVEQRHPLAEQAFELSVRLHEDCREREWVPRHASPEHPVLELISRASQAGAKIAGALNGEAWPPNVASCASKIVRLKRAHEYLEDARVAADACREQNLVDQVWLATVHREINELVGACEGLIAELRAMLE